MTREILFKAKRLDNGEWIEGYPHLNGEDWIMWLVGKGIGEPIDPNTICQYTGLTDKNGNKIWENDVVHYKERYEDIYKVVYYSSMCRFVFVKNGWKGIEMDFGDELKCSVVEVIGNIFDNPELLEGGGVDG